MAKSHLLVVPLQILECVATIHVSLSLTVEYYKYSHSLHHAHMSQFKVQGYLANNNKELCSKSILLLKKSIIYLYWVRERERLFLVSVFPRPVKSFVNNKT